MTIRDWFSAKTNDDCPYVIDWELRRADFVDIDRRLRELEQAVADRGLSPSNL